jgi:hypothetical protein
MITTGLYEDDRTPATARVFPRQSPTNATAFEIESNLQNYKN